MHIRKLVACTVQNNGVSPKHRICCVGLKYKASLLVAGCQSTLPGIDYNGWAKFASRLRRQQVGGAI